MIPLSPTVFPLDLIEKLDILKSFLKNLVLYWKNMYVKMGNICFAQQSISGGGFWLENLEKS